MKSRTKNDSKEKLVGLRREELMSLKENPSKIDALLRNIDDYVDNDALKKFNYTNFMRTLKNPKEAFTRSVVKIGTYRIIDLLVVAPLVAWFTTHQLKIATEISAIYFVVKIPWQTLYERVWTHIKWGYKNNGIVVIDSSGNKLMASKE
ncbi:MAG: DUF2061 domain-containing protein [Candidatus Micrarchaeaceae archaeon]|jgi:uncharacterized membrane protein